MIGYARKFNENTTNTQLLKRYDKTWEKVEKLMKINFESKPVYGDDEKYKKAKIKIYAGSVITNFHDKKVPKQKISYKCLSMIMVDSVIKANKKYNPQTFLEECKYLQQEKNYIDEDLKSDSKSNDETESDSDSNDKTESDIDNGE